MAERKNKERLTASTLCGSDLVYDFCCDVCSEEGKNNEGTGFCQDCQEYLCDNCLKIHKKTKLTRHHVLLGKHEMPKNKSSKKTSNDSCTEPCPRHQGEIIKYYCDVHDTLACSVCITIDHRQCDGVGHIPEISENLTDSEEYGKHVTEMRETAQKLHDVISEADANKVIAEECCSEAVRVVQLSREELNKALDKQEDNIRADIEKRKTDDIEKMKFVSDKSKDMLQHIEKLISKVDALQQNKQMCRLFVTMKEHKKQMSALQTGLSDVGSRTTVQKYTFTPSKEVSGLLQTAGSLGKITIDECAPQSRPQVQKKINPVEMTATHAADISVRTVDDKEKCYISGCAILPGYKLVICDYTNHNIKVFDTRQTTLSNRLNVSHQPWDIATVSSDQVAVTFPFENQIKVLKVTDTLTVEKTIHVSGRCRGIVCHKGNLIVTFNSPQKIEILDFQGTLVKTIVSGFTVSSLSNISYVTVNGDNNVIYVSNDNVRNVTSLTLEGSMKAVYTDMELDTPRGMYIDSRGFVLVCARNSHNVHLIDTDCKKIKILLTSEHGLKFPQALCYDKETRKLYVGMSDDMIKVYQLS